MGLIRRPSPSLENARSFSLRIETKPGNTLDQRRYENAPHPLFEIISPPRLWRYRQQGPVRAQIQTLVCTEIDKSVCIVFAIFRPSSRFGTVPNGLHRIRDAEAFSAKIDRILPAARAMQQFLPPARFQTSRPPSPPTAAK